ncbi:DUF2971 domain-containing protein [Paenibacillus sp. FSL W8-0187]|uniref:DUF2971 domain-containing protein n=1 Tax=unclassified Paenibacillus TaxID=185978 RepID=UPI0030DD916F
MRHRSDMSTYVFHLTKKTKTMSASEVLLKILNDKKLIGSTTDSGFIVGDSPAVCFQDVPVHALCQNTLYEQNYREDLGGKIRYQPVGIGFKKKTIFHKGGRPVIYESSIKAKKFLPEEEWWRIVDFHLGNAENITDWTHEREWRVKGDMTFKLSDVVVLLSKGTSYKRFMKNANSQLLEEIDGIVVLDPVLS